MPTVIIDSPPGTEVIGKGRHTFPFSFQIPDRYVFFLPLGYLVLVMYVTYTYMYTYCLQENPVHFQSLQRKSCS